MKCQGKWLGEKIEKYADYDKDVYEETLNLAERIAVEQIYPANEEGDREHCTYLPDTNDVKIPKAYHAPLDAFYETGFMGISDDPEIGGMGMPSSVGLSVNEYMSAASVALPMYPGLSHGAMLLVDAFGTDKQKEQYIDKIMSGEWGGTMGLTEPGAGSDVGALSTKAVKQADGTYLITGQKIFISSAENDYYDNMLHPVLARIEGDPKGTKGISIFLVPKFLVNEDGSVGERNDVVCAGIEHKMGLNGSATCQLSLGDEGKCIGYLLGDERKGMKIMFKMMNEARLGVGLQGLALSSASYMHAVTYAKNRIQGVHVTQMLNPEAEGVAIIEHPDVKRMLLWMKSHVEGMRILSYTLALCLDLENYGEGEEAKEAKGLAELLIPICKAGNTDKSVQISSEAVMVYGGYGYTQDYPVELLMRDSKITTIYEGTNGIQSMDLTMRKILMNKEQYNLSVFVKRVNETIAKAKGLVDDKYITLVERSLIITLPKMKEIVGDKKGEERATLLAENADAAYYSGRVLSAQFFIGSELPKVFGRFESLLAGESAVIKATTPVFTGALDE